MDIKGIEAIVAGSNTILTWSMSIIGASLLAIISTSYNKPIGKWSKLIYLFFIPGWIYLANAINLGNIIARRGIMAALNSDSIADIVLKMNDEYAAQLNYFNTALIFYGIWLLFYLVWWILQDFIPKLNKP